MKRPPPLVVTVNGTPAEVLPRLEYDQLLRLAGKDDDGRPYAITWEERLADGRRNTGSLARGEVLVVSDGMAVRVEAPAGA